MATVPGYHGCQKVFADGVRSGRIPLTEWKASQNLFDWLGEGIYFWEASRSRAEQWDVDRFGADGDVLTAEIDLGQCLDLLEDTYHDDLRAAYWKLRAHYRREGLRLPRNEKKRHNLDNLIINEFVEFMATEGIRFQTVRAVFEEGRPLFPGSAIRSQSHIQIAVRDVQCIRLLAGQGENR